MKNNTHSTSHERNPLHHPVGWSKLPKFLVKRQTSTRFFKMKSTFLHSRLDPWMRCDKFAWENLNLIFDRFWSFFHNFWSFAFYYFYLVRHLLLFVLIFWLFHFIFWRNCLVFENFQAKSWTIVIVYQTFEYQRKSSLHEAYPKTLQRQNEPYPL